MLAVRRLARDVRGLEAGVLARLMADTGDPAPADVSFAQPTLIYWRADGGGRRGTLSEVEGYYRSLDRGRLVVLGEPGAGKTVLAIKLVLDLAAAVLAAPDSVRPFPPVPVRLSLPSFDPGGGLDAVSAEVVTSRLNGRQVAHQLEWSPSWVSRLLSGKRNASQLHVVALLALCRVTGAERDRLLALCQEQHGSWLPPELVTLIDHENKAVAISDFQSMMVPGLLQTGDYARAVTQDPRTVPADEVEDRVAARLARQSLFTRDRPVRFTFFIHEFVLRLPVGGSAVMFEQLHHLLRMSMRPYLTLRVVPAAARRACRNRRTF